MLGSTDSMQVKRQRCYGAHNLFCRLFASPMQPLANFFKKAVHRRYVFVRFMSSFVPFQLVQFCKKIFIRVKIYMMILRIPCCVLILFCPQRTKRVFYIFERINTYAFSMQFVDKTGFSDISMYCKASF